MGSVLGGKKSSTTSSKNRVFLPGFVRGPLEDLVSRADDLSYQEYQPYTGERFADFNQDQLNAFQSIRDLQGTTDGMLERAYSLNEQAGQGITPESISQFMSPYMQNVVDIQKREALRDYEILKNQLGDQAAMTGSFGGSRQAIAEAEAQRNIGQRLSDIQGIGQQNAYQTALQTAIQNNQLQQGAAGQAASLAGVGQGLSMQQIAALQGIGGQQQAMDQAGLDFAYQQFLEQKAQPYQNLQFLGGTLFPAGQLMAGSNQTQTTTTKSSVSPLSAALGIASMAMGIPGIGAALGGATGGLLGAAGMGGATAGAIASALPTAAGNSFFQNAALQANQGLMGPYSPVHSSIGRNGYKEGGMVSKDRCYADGGLVDYLASKSPAFMQKKFFGIPEAMTTPYFGLFGEREELTGLEKVPGRIGKSVSEALADIGVNTAEAIKPAVEFATLPESEYLKRQNERDRQKYSAEEMQREMDMIEQLKASESPEDNTTATLLETLGKTKKEEIASSSTIQEKSTPQQQQQKQQGVNLPLLGMAARLLASPGESTAEAFGHGLGTYVGLKTAENATEYEKKADQADRLLKQMNADTNRMNAESSYVQAALKMQSEPIKQMKEQIDLEQAKAKLNQTLAMSPQRQEIFKTLSETDPVFPRLSPMEQAAKVEQSLGAILGSVGGVQQDRRQVQKDGKLYWQYKDGTIEPVK